MNDKKLVVIESPCRAASKTRKELYKNYARICMADSFSRGELPYASQLLYDQEGVLNDDDPVERQMGIEAGFAWTRHADFTAVYVDLGITSGMKHGMDEALRCGRQIVRRRIWNGEER